MTEKYRACNDGVTQPCIVGVGRGLLGVVGLPLSGALGLVGAMTTGLASSTGLTAGPAMRRRGHHEGLHLLDPLFPQCTCELS